MNQENFSKLTDWIKENKKCPVEQLRQLAIKGGASKEEFNVALNAANVLEYRGVGIRFCAFAVDMMICGIFLWMFGKIFHNAHAGDSYSFSIGSVSNLEGTIIFNAFVVQLYFFTIFAYFVLFELVFGATLGKLATGIRVVKSSGKPLDFKASLIRNLARVVDFFPLFNLAGVVSIWNSKTKQRIGDKLAKTVVVSKNSAIE